MRLIAFLFMCLSLSCGDQKPQKKPCPCPVPSASPAPSPIPASPIPSPGSGGNPLPFPLPFPIPGGGGGLPIPIPTGIPGGGAGTPNGPSGDTTTQVTDLLKEINKAREGKGLSKVEIDTKLSCAAQKHSDDVGVNGVCSHTGSDGSSPWSRAESCGTSANVENIACGQGTPAEAVQAWTLSPGHAAIMYDAGQKYMGGGWKNNYWTAIFRK